MQTNYQKITSFLPTNYSNKCTSRIEIYHEQDNQRTCFHVIENLAIWHWVVYAYISLPSVESLTGNSYLLKY